MNQQAQDLRRCCAALEADNKRLRDALREALAGVLVDDLLPLLPAEYIAKVRAALAQEQGGSDGDR